MRTLTAALAVCLFFTGCSTREHLPTDFALPAVENVGARAPVGRFTVHGTSTDPENKAPNLSQYFFHDFLRGFNIDNIAILAMEDRKAFDELWKSARNAVTETFFAEMRELLVNRETVANAYTFHYAGGFH